jgi:hypothetical protein
LSRSLRSLRSALLAAGWFLFVLFLGMLPEQDALYFADSVAYLNHPEPYYVENPHVTPNSPLPRMKIVGQRRPLYPAYLRAFLPSLPRWQFATWLASWSLAGWVLMGLPGLVAGSLVSLLPAGYVWQLMILSEPLNLSLTALLVTSSFLLLRRFDAARFGLFTATLLLLTFNRDANAYLHPIFAASIAGHLLWKGRRRLRGVAPHAAAVLGVALVCFALSRYLVVKHEGYQFMITNAFLVRILPDTEARVHFRSLGMPVSRPVLRYAGMGGTRGQLPLLHQAPEFIRWVHQEGLRHYTVWLVMRPASWGEAARAWFREANRISHYLAEEERLPATVRALRGLSDLGWAHPASTALLALGLIAVLWRAPDPRHRQAAWLLLTCLLASFLQAFVGYHGDGIEVNRHMAGASVLLKASLVLGAFLLVLAFVPLITARRGRSMAVG